MSTIFNWFIFLPPSPCLTKNSMLILETNGLRQNVLMRNWPEDLQFGIYILLFWRKPSCRLSSRCWLTSVEGAVQGSDWCCIESKLYRSQMLSAILFMNADIYTSSVQCLQINFPFSNGLFNEMSESTTTAASQRLHCSYDHSDIQVLFLQCLGKSTYA